MQIFIYYKATLNVSGVIAPVIRSIKNCTRSLRYRSYYLYRRLRVQFLILLMTGAMTPETYRVVLQQINICILLHLLDFYSRWIMMHGTTSFKIKDMNTNEKVFPTPIISSTKSWSSKQCDDSHLTMRYAACQNTAVTIFGQESLCHYQNQWSHSTTFFKDFKDCFKGNKTRQQCKPSKLKLN